MDIRQLIYFAIQIAVFFAFPTIWNWMVTYIPWLTKYLDPNSVFGLVVGLVAAAIFWLLGILRIVKFVQRVRLEGVRKW